MPSRRTFAARLARGEYGGATTVEPSLSAIDLAELIAALPAASSVVAATAFPVLSGADAYQATAAQVLSYIAANASGTWGISITGAAPAASISGTTLAANVVTSSLTTIGTLVAGAVPASLVTSGTFGAGAYNFTAGSTADGFAVTSTGARQLRVAYNDSSYVTVNVSSIGITSFGATGSGARFIFQDEVSVQSGVFVTGAVESDSFYALTSAGVGIAPSSTFLNLAAGTTAKSSARIAHGVAPTAPVNGDVWGVSAESLYYRNNGTTQYASWTRQAAQADAAGGVVIDAEARTALNGLLAKLRTINVIAT